MVICIVDSSMGLNVMQEIKGIFKRRKCSTSTGASFADIHEELQIDILSRLPPKPLSRCNCVSKHWNTTLTIKAFLFRHFASYDKHPKLGFVACSRYSGENTILSLKLNDDNTPKTTTLTVIRPAEELTSIFVGSYCSMNTGGTENTEEIIRAKDVYLTDFHTSKYSCMSNICNDLICLIDSSKRVGLLNIRTLDFIHLPAVTKSEFAVGFWYALGFDPVNKVFKVLCIYTEIINKGFNTKAATLTVGSKNWNPVEYDSSYSHSANNFCLDGVIYWVHQNKIDNVFVITVVAFDLNREVFRGYELVVTPIEDETFGYYLTSLKGCPTLFSWNIKSDENHEIQQLTLFNHKNPNASWTKRSFISQSFPMMFYCSKHRMCVRVAGGSILVQYVESIQASVESEEQDDTKSSWYILYNLEKYAI